MIVEYVELKPTDKPPAYLLKMTKAELVEQADIWMLPRKFLLRQVRIARKQAGRRNAL